MSEPTWTPPFELWKHDGGIDGWDAKQWKVATFSNKAKAEAYLTARDYTYKNVGRYEHKDVAQRHTMGQISYEIRPVKVEVPHDPA